MDTKLKYTLVVSGSVIFFHVLEMHGAFLGKDSAAPPYCTFEADSPEDAVKLAQQIHCALEAWAANWFSKTPACNGYEVTKAPIVSLL